MPETASSTAMILLYAIMGLLVLVLAFLSGIARRLMRIESRLRQDDFHQETVLQAPSAAETSKGGAFETFLSEDPQRRNLSKAEQFAEYRRWRQKNGLNWSNS
jgi:hypothetical protein